MDRKGPYHNAEEDVFLTCHVFIKLMYRGLSQNYDVSGEIDDDDHENSPEYTDSDEKMTPRMTLTMKVMTKTAMTTYIAEPRLARHPERQKLQAIRCKTCGWTPILPKTTSFSRERSNKGRSASINTRLVQNPSIGS